MSTLKVDTINEKSTNGAITIANTGNGNTIITPAGTGKVVIDGLTHPHADGSANQVMQTNGSGGLSFATISTGFTHATPQSGSGTSMTFGSIPAGTSLIVLTMHDFSSSGGDEWMVQIGDSGGIETADYRSQRSTNTNGSLGSDGTPNSNESQGFGITVDSASNAFGGQMILSLHHPTNHTWTSSSSFRRDGFDHSWGAGSKDLSAELTQVRITTKGGSESFDAGTINIMYQ